MKIINLKSEPSCSDGPELKITAIKQAVKNENRVNVFVNNEYSFSLDIAQLVDFKLKVGTILSEEDLAKYKEASAFGKLYQRTLEWVLTRPRSVRETRDHLRERSRKSTIQIDNSLLEQIITKLSEKGYLNDYKFAEYYVENRFIKKGISRKRLSLELAKKGVSQGIIEEVLTENPRSDLEEIQKIIAKKRHKYDDEKLTAYLVRQGFNYDLVRDAIRQDSSVQ